MAQWALAPNPEPTNTSYAQGSPSTIRTDSEILMSHTQIFASESNGMSRGCRESQAEWAVICGQDEV